MQPGGAGRKGSFPGSQEAEGPGISGAQEEGKGGLSLAVRQVELIVMHIHALVWQDSCLWASNNKETALAYKPPTQDEEEPLSPGEEGTCAQ